MLSAQSGGKYSQLYKALWGRNMPDTRSKHTGFTLIAIPATDTPKEVNMKSGITSLALAGLLACAGFATSAQTTTPQASQAPAMADSGAKHRDMGMHGKHDPAKRDAMFAKRSAELKTKLKITADQESAWTSFTTAMKPAARMDHQRMDRSEMEKLTTPERIDKMRAVHTQHMTERTAAMDKRSEATKTLYAALNAEQKKTFDAMHANMGRQHGGHGGGDQGYGVHGMGVDKPAVK